MTLRARIALLATVAIVIAVAASTGIVYAAEGADLRRQVDADLTLRASNIAADLATSGNPDRTLRPTFGSPIAYAQVVSSDGEVVALAPGTPTIPPDVGVTSVASGTRGRYVDVATVDGVELRVLTVPLHPGAALQVARPFQEASIHLTRMAWVFALVLLSGFGLSLVLGRLVADGAIRPLDRLVSTAERVARTRDASVRIPLEGRVELDRLASSINSMLAALEGSLASQRRLVADASHELQTPLTSLRTDVEVLAHPNLDDGDRQTIAAEVINQVDDLSRLVTNLVDLGREQPHAGSMSPVRLDRMAETAATWVRRVHPSVDFEVVRSPTEVIADFDSARRLLRNLLDNAGKWSPPGGTVTIEVSPERVVVSDQGPGIPPQERQALFERFRRGPGASAVPGAGLGLAIVHKVCVEHGWEPRIEEAVGGGASVVIDLQPSTSSQLHTAALSEAQERGVR